MTVDELPNIILEVNELNLGYGSLQVVFGASLNVRKGELIGLVGGNGSGKSTILRAISGMIKPISGKILFKGEEISGFEPHQMAMRGLAHVPMGRQLFPNLTVQDNILLGSYLPKLRPRRNNNLEKVYSLFPDIKNFSPMLAGSLSGGQQQMVAIGRALMLEPDLLILDEPSLGLSPLYVKQVMHAIRKIADLGFPVLLVEQNIKQVLQFSHRAYVLENGRLVLEGPSAELQGHPMIKKAYLGL
ncbi:ABC transporter ATP-binding protein [Polaromonas sp. CG_23.6]|uniref:ABC transporter ATP-binding protein n=1 Tax=Polaromonas sp. CG_23.6 TaxID=2760709 RepID=UPI0024737829|nr:ABC transporter ATP-binding protein [Polaromonas sp. CG_23.6]MDH6186855.1 branched-chain amino acid transport system ATP-binding protein [Polaromonas sp. CG_23.6]